VVVVIVSALAMAKMSVSGALIDSFGGAANREKAMKSRQSCRDFTICAHPKYDVASPDVFSFQDVTCQTSVIHSIRFIHSPDILHIIENS
jgi:hypothetical protein